MRLPLHCLGDRASQAKSGAQRLLNWGEQVPVQH